MSVVLAFSVLLLVAVLISEHAERSVLSTAVLFLVGGFVLGDGRLGLVTPSLDTTEPFAELALFAVLFTDGMRTPFSTLRAGWRLPGRALLFGMPITFVMLAILARIVVGLPWLHAFLAAAALSPTDPVFAAAIVGRRGIPHRLTHLLNVESGLNDGLALPAVVVLIHWAEHDDAGIATIVAEVALGVALGVAIPWVAVHLGRRNWLAATGVYETLFGLAIGMVLFALASTTHANEFLAAFVGGITLATFDDDVRARFVELGEVLAEVLKLAAVLVFGATIPNSVLDTVGEGGLVFAVAALVLARPVAILLALVRAPIGRDERLAAAWFGPKGFASVVFGLLVLHASFDGSVDVFNAVALTVACSIVAHSTTDVLVARRLASGSDAGTRDDRS